MAYNDILLSLLAAAAMATLAGVCLIKTDKKSQRSKIKLDTADVDMVALTAIATFVAVMVACHPEWVS
jgi:hypothetical protein